MGFLSFLVQLICILCIAGNVIYTLNILKKGISINKSENIQENKKINLKKLIFLSAGAFFLSLLVFLTLKETLLDMVTVLIIVLGLNYGSYFKLKKEIELKEMLKK